MVLQGQRGYALDPVAALLNHLHLNNPQPGDALFDFVEAYNCFQMTHTMLMTVTKLLFACQGGDPASLSGHSYRRGMATTACQAGVPDACSMHAQLWREKLGFVSSVSEGDWASMTYKIYCELSQECRAKLTSAVFAQFTHMAFASMLPADTPWGHLGNGEVLGPVGTDAQRAVSMQA